MKHTPLKNIEQPSYTRSLKAILKQTRIPLSRYINQKPPNKNEAKRQFTSYFEKLQGIIQQQEFYRNSLTPVLNLTTENSQDQQNKRSKSFKHKMNIQHCRQFKNMNNLTKNEQQLISNIPNTNITTICYQKQMKAQIINYKKYEKLSVSELQFERVELKEVLGCGANASVRLGRNTQTGKLYGVKIYEKYKLLDEKKKNRVYKQIKILSKLENQNIVNLIAAYEDKRQIHLVFEYIEGASTLQDYYRHKMLNLNQLQINRIILEIAKGIQYLHRMGVAHRDIKPQNILISSTSVKIIDFGFATSQHKTQIHCGTPNFMAPELFMKNRSYCPFKVDIWAFGVLIFYLYESSYPFHGFNEKDLSLNIRKGSFIPRKMPSHLVIMLNGMLNIDPTCRSNAFDILSQLQHPF